MAIKISKVIKDLNVGRQTIEDFLHKKGIEIEASINARIEESVYEMLVKEFKPDMDLKSKSDKMANERQKEKAKQNAAAKDSREIKTVIPGQKPKVLGKIDLDAAGRPKPVVPQPQPAPAPQEEKVVTPVEPVAEPQPKPQPAAETPVEQPTAVEQQPAASTRSRPRCGPRGEPCC